MFKTLSKIKINTIYFATGFIFVIFIDQISKYLILTYYPDIIYKSFGLFGNYQFYWEGFFVALILIFFLIYRKTFLKNDATSLLFGAVIAAAISNMFDKLTRSVIIDWIPIFSLKFNLADLILIICGTGLIYYLWKK
jgi:lipoprotein signal peptidase